MINQSTIQHYQSQLDQHPVYEALEDIADLRIFMQHHVYSVWDFMSLIKFLQSAIAPTVYPWVPRGSADVRRFINELVLEEESDETHIPGQYSSHFELYLRAMQEIGADTSNIQHFIAQVKTQPVADALKEDYVPRPAADFTGVTFDYINREQPHEVAALLALGREHIIPTIFRSILSRIGIGPDQAPIFHFYLNRHVHLDEDFHAPLSLKMLTEFIAGDQDKKQQAMQAADRAVAARIKFWDAVRQAIMENKILS